MNKIITLFLIVIISLLAVSVFATDYITKQIPITVAPTSGTSGYASYRCTFRGSIVAASITMANVAGTPTCTTYFSDNDTTAAAGASTGGWYWASSAINENATTAIITPDKPVPIITSSSGTTYIKFILSTGVLASTVGYMNLVYAPTK